MNLKFKTKKIKIDVDLNCLKEIFGEDVTQEFEIKALSGHEVALCNDAVKVNKNTRAIIEKIISPLSKDKAEGIQEALGLDNTKLTDTYIFNMNAIHHGIVNPKRDYEKIVLFCNFFAVASNSVFNEIMGITGVGAELGE